MHTIRIVGIFLFVCVSAFSPISFSNIAAVSQSVSVEEITGYQEWNQSRTIDKNVIVRPGATLVIGKGVTLDITSQVVIFRVEGSFFVKGTVKDPVVIQSISGQGSFFIETATNSKTMIRNAEIANGGTQAFLVKKPHKNVAFAANYQGAIQVNGGNVDIQNTTFRNNLYAVIVSSSTANVRVNRSRFIDNDFDVEANGGNTDFQYNWWGTSDGPQQTCYDYSGQQYCYYEKIDGNFNHSNHLTHKSFRDPVLIIPGILGSQEEEGVLVLDPVYHTYDNLYDALIDNGYVPEKDLFVFPYEWRDSNIKNAKLLQGKINEIKQLTHWPKVDIVAHSMGGLLAREYVESSYYGYDVDQLITLATPHLGAPEAYIKWDGAGWFFSPLDLYMKHIITQEAEKSGFSNVFDYIHNRPIASLQELLPMYDYLYDLDKNGELRSYPNNYPRNEFLEHLNSRAENLDKVEFDKIVGNLEGENTIGGIDVVNVDMGKYWVHGYPLGFEIPLGSRGMKLTSGDRTVPLYSAKSESLKSDYLIELSSDHRGIVTDAQSDVLELLTNNRPQNTVRRSLIHRLLFVSVYSPIDIQIISPTGKKVGKNFENGTIYDEITGAYYTGYDTDNEFITIPNPEEGEYRIFTQGTGTGEYRVEVVKITEGAAPSDGAKESLVTFAGTATPDATEEKKIELLADDTVVSKENQDSLPPTTEISLSGTQGTNGWYTSDVSITLSATDNENGSGIEKTEYSLDHGATWSVYTDQVILSQEGTTMIQYFSTDKQGNHEAAKALSVKIDKTAPEAKIVFDPDTERLVITGTDNISQTVSVKTIELRSSPWMGFENGSSWLQNPFQKKFTTATLLDEAGHQTRITFENRKKSPKYRIDIRLQSLAYDGVNIPLPETFLRYQWQRNSKKQYRFFIAYIDTNTESIVSHYSPKYDETLLTKQPKGSDTSSVTKQKLPTMIIPGILTEQGKIHLVY